MVMEKFRAILVLTLLLTGFQSDAQLKYLVDDFEGMAENQSELKKEGCFSFGNANASAQKTFTAEFGYSGHRSMEISWNGKKSFGGWGKGLGQMVDLVPGEDFLNFYI